MQRETQQLLIDALDWGNYIFYRAGGQSHKSIDFVGNHVGAFRGRINVYVNRVRESHAKSKELGLLPWTVRRIDI